MDIIRLLDITGSQLSVDAVLATVADPAAGGTVLFTGTVRDVDHGAGVASLSYTAHPSAIAELRKVAEKVVADFPVRALVAQHRVGDLAIGDLAVVIAVSCPHRAEAFAAARQLIDDLKQTVPIWKYQLFADGSSEWVGLRAGETVESDAAEDG